MARKGERIPPEVRAKLSAANRGRKHSERAKENMRRAQLGRKHPEEVKKKISESNRGKKMSPEARAKMSAAKKGKPVSEEMLQKLHEAAKKPRSEETRRRISEARKRLLADPERRKAIGQRIRRFWASLTPEEKSKIALPGRLACLEATRLREPTSIERAVAEELTRLDIKFEQQVIFKYYVADIYLPGHRTIIECDGDYWHSTPEMKAHDKKRDRWLAGNGFAVIRLKECDIRADVSAAVQEGLKGIL